MDLGMYNAGVEDHNLENLLKKMDKFNDDLRENASIVEIRYKEMEIDSRELHEKVEELEAQVEHQEKELMIQIDGKEEALHQLKIMQNEALETERVTTNFEINHNSREKELEKECDVMRMEANTMAKENEQLRSEVNQKFMEISELQSEIQSLNKNLENLMEMNLESENKE
jgi:multidrug resistance efflux pump